MPLKKNTVVLEKYNKEWKKMYQEEEKNLKKIIGNYMVGIEHVGSTSIPGLSAKPVIDIMVVVNHLNDVEKFKHLFKSEDDYNFRDDGGEKGEYLVRKGPEDARTYFIHIIEKNSTRYFNFTKFKSYLLNHPKLIKKYEQLKQELCLKYKDDRKSYTAGKNDFIQNILKFDDEENN